MPNSCISGTIQPRISATPPPVPRRVDVDDPLAGQPLGQAAEPLDFLVADDLFVAVQEPHGAVLGTGGASAR